MSLLVWYPLISDMRNQGVGDADLTVSSSPSFGSGKIGNALIGGGSSTWTAVQTSKIFNNNTISICFWIYIDAPEGDTTAAKKPMIFGNDGMGHRKYSLFQYPSVNDLHWSWNTSADSTYYGSVAYGALPSYKWTHVAITYDNPSVKVYLNGELKATSSIAMNWNNFADETQVFRECQYRKLNDFRVYSNCLSPKEVKEISKGLVLHYPLNRGGFGVDNNIPVSSIVNRGCTSFSYSGNEGTMVCPTGSTAWGFGFYIGNTSIKWKSGQTWLISLDVYTPQSITWNCDINNKPDVSDVSQYTGNDYDITSQRRTYTNGVSGSTLKVGWNKVWFTQTAPSTYGLYNYSTNFGIITKDLTNPITIKIKNVKGEIIESGFPLEPTPWLPNSTDALYSSMGLDSNIEYDVSGYGNNGVQNNTPTFSSDAPKYKTSIHFDGTNQTVKLPNLSTLLPDSIFTFNVWFKRLEAEPSSKSWETILGGPSGFELESCSTNSVHDSKIRAYSWGGGTFAFEFDKWNMLTMVQNGTNALFYLNGELKLTGTFKALVSGNYFLGSWRDFTSQNYRGYMSDARIYATALSAEDVLALYNTPTSIASNGTLLTQGEISEV